jgi:MptA/FolE2 family GTP cyclohydrolase
MTIGEFTRQLWDELAKTNPDSTYIHAEVRGETVLTNHGRHYGNGAPAFKPCELVAIAEGEQNQTPLLLIGVRAKICLACPQAQAVIRWMNTKSLLTSFTEEQVQQILETVSLPTHNQLAEGEILIQVPAGEEVRHLSLELLAILEEAASSPTYEYLKRHDEGICVNSLHWKPRFVEDVIRESMARVAREFLNWPDELSVRMGVTNFESTFEYVLDAHTTIALGEIKRLSTFSSPEAIERG